MVIERNNRHVYLVRFSGLFQKLTARPVVVDKRPHFFEGKQRVNKA